MRELAIGAVAAAAFVVALGASDGAAKGGLSAAAAASPMSNLDYATEAARSDMYEIQAGQLATTRAVSPRVKDFGKMMVTDHKATTDALKGALTNASMGMPSDLTLDPRRQDMLRQLNSLTGPDFDRAFLSQQLTAHQEALALHQTYAQGGDSPVLRGIAGKIAPRVQQHLDMLRQMGAD